MLSIGRKKISQSTICAPVLKDFTGNLQIKIFCRTVGLEKPREMTIHWDVCLSWGWLQTGRVEEALKYNLQVRSYKLILTDHWIGDDFRSLSTHLYPLLKVDQFVLKSRKAEKKNVISLQSLVSCHLHTIKCQKVHCLSPSLTNLALAF